MSGKELNRYIVVMKIPRMTEDTTIFSTDLEYGTEEFF